MATADADRRSRAGCLLSQYKSSETGSRRRSLPRRRRSARLPSLGHHVLSPHRSCAPGQWLEEKKLRRISSPFLCSRTVAIGVQIWAEVREVTEAAEEDLGTTSTTTSKVQQTVPSTKVDKAVCFPGPSHQTFRCFQQVT